MKGTDPVWTATHWGTVVKKQLRDAARDNDEFFVTPAEAWDFVAGVFEAQVLKATRDVEAAAQKAKEARLEAQRYSPPAEVAP